MFLKSFAIAVMLILPSLIGMQDKTVKIDVADPESYGATNPLNKSVVVGLKIGF
jgi:hypothetical protein